MRNHFVDANFALRHKPDRDIKVSIVKAAGGQGEVFGKGHLQRQDNIPFGYTINHNTAAPCTSQDGVLHASFASHAVDDDVELFFKIIFRETLTYIDDLIHP